MPFKDSKEGSTHYQNDGCGEPEHNDVVIEHCAEPACPECSQAAYKAGYKAGRIKVGETARYNYSKGYDDGFLEGKKNHD